MSIIPQPSPLYSLKFSPESLAREYRDWQRVASGSDIGGYWLVIRNERGYYTTLRGMIALCWLEQHISGSDHE